MTKIMAVSGAAIASKISFSSIRPSMVAGTAMVDENGATGNGRVVAPLICEICGEEMILPAGGQSHALCECGEMQLVESRKVRAA